MTDDPINVIDRRRITPAGVVQRAGKSTKPKISYNTFKNASERAWRHVETHLERSIRSGGLRPEDQWTAIWGLALSARQTYIAIVRLLADKNKPHTLPLPASVLVRSLFECLGNLMALTASERAFHWFAGDGYRYALRQLRAQRIRFGDQTHWKSWLDDMERASEFLADWGHLTPGHRRQFDSIAEWPTPAKLTRPTKLKGGKEVAALLRGNRAELFAEALALWYSQLSSYAHQRAAAAMMAVFANRPDEHEEPGALDSLVLSQAMIFLTCILSELEYAVEMPKSVDLRVMWNELWKLDEYARRFIEIRYRKLLGLPYLANGMFSSGVGSELAQPNH